MQLWLVITERLHLFPLYRSVQSAVRPLNSQLGIYAWVENDVCFKGELLLLIICDGGSSLHFNMADKHPTLCMVEQFLNQHSFGFTIVRLY